MVSKKENKILILSITFLFLIFATAFILNNCNSNLGPNHSNRQIDEDNGRDDLKIANPYTDISAEDAYNMINNKTLYPDLLVLDVRNQNEYDTSHICNATLIPQSQLESRISELDPYKDT